MKNKDKAEDTDTDTDKDNDNDKDKRNINWIEWGSNSIPLCSMPDEPEYASSLLKGLVVEGNVTWLDAEPTYVGRWKWHWKREREEEVRKFEKWNEKLMYNHEEEQNRSK